jgi:tripartite-type tricarboxylate transporter receptor subunit TctC
MRKLSGWLVGLAVLFAASLGAVSSAHADYPDQPIRFIVGYAPGGGSDYMARLIAQKLSEKWGQPVNVENREGADGTIAEGVAATTAPDGYTICLVSPSHTFGKFEYELSYDPEKAFEPVVLLGTAPDVLVVTPSFPANTFADLVKLAKDKPGAYNYASAGKASAPYLEMELVKKATGIDVVNVNYKGTGPMVTALLGGEVQMMFVGVRAAAEQVKAGKLRALAVSTAERSPALPDVPTMAEAANLPGYASGNWYGIVVPAGTPKEIVTKMNAAIVEILNEPELQAALRKQGIMASAGTPDAFAAFISKEVVKWDALLKKN